MRVAIEAGAEIDIATPAEVREIVSASRFERQPLRVRLRGTAVTPNPTAAFIIDLGVPSQGYRWDVRHVVISGVNPAVAFTGSGFVCVGSPELVGGLVDPFAAQDGGNSLPASTSFSRDQCIVQGTEHLYVVVSGATAGTTAAAHAMVLAERINVEEVPVQ